MSFFDTLSGLSREQLRMALYSTTPAQVEAAIEGEQGNLSHLLALLSPAAGAYLEPMAQRAAALTRRRFGHNIGLYLPLYLSNLCANECDYCGFTMSNKLKRKVLSHDELKAEMAVIKPQGFDSILLVSGEHETKVGIDYFAEILPLVKAEFSHVAMEVQPLSYEHYGILVEKGLDAVMLYQETYEPDTYRRHHLRGNKQDYGYRLESPERIAQAGVDKIGLGVLLGLDDWRMDALLMGYHLDYLERRFWRSRYSISLPRLRPCVGGISPKVQLSDKGLVQLICAFRLFNEQLEISLSTRETPSLRDNLLGLGITQMSAGSRTEPGGYVNPAAQLDQFEISDERSAAEVASVLRSRGFTPVWKDWEAGWIGTN
ncbi:2-iminoacetate synthase ThiH [Shewanella insulae]|uniref:2-iminoacetate synthase ThiH n=1 Tax=Shewanella insulae TaxID=2681496 RepID=UPI001EFE4798|nr:2-iminoacetate synthase ThiH [Shewanella insulae]MCG9756881.1 2-iminoacetate synthase ThiH [Shewanella insulae]